jgi:radical SAM superfamily enzyme YgiQ (UPF0313 family)
LRVALINPPYTFSNIPRVPPLTIALLYAELEKADLGSIQAIDFDLEFNHRKENIDFFINTAIQRVEKFEPTIICMTCMTAQFPFIVLFSKKYKSLHPETKIVVGGWMPTLNPELILRLSGCDAVVRGEGDRTLLRLLQEINRDKLSVNGVSYKSVKGQKIVHNPNSPLLSKKELNDLPLPNYNALPPLSKYQPEFRNYSFVVQASRGCINHKCIFCWNSTKYCETQWRSRSPKKWLRKLDILSTLIMVTILCLLTTVLEEKLPGLTSLFLQ